MPRNALAQFFERIVIASLPLAAPACSTKAATPPAMTTPSDLSVASSDTPDLGGNAADGAPSQRDLAGLTGDLADVCDNLANPNDPPPAIVPFPASDIPDGGFATPCQAGTFCNEHCPAPQYTTCCGPDKTDGGYALTCILNCSGPGPGRRPPGLVASSSAGDCAVGRYFADAAHLEAASVHSFRRLARELDAHGAPRTLVAAARRALRDEVRHARAMRRLARAHGSTPPAVRVAATPSRSLEELALENVVEGCVRETFAALLAVYQSRAAADTAVRSTMAAIAPDETRHAELAWAIDEWAQPRLDECARRRITNARRRAATELAAECASIDATLARSVGLPSRQQTAALLETTRRALWS
jgi:hypothetical protein